MFQRAPVANPMTVDPLTPVRVRVKRTALRFSLTCAVFALGCGADKAVDVAGTPAFMKILAGSSQTGAAGLELKDAVTVLVTDERNKPVAGQLASFRVVSGGGSFFAGSGPDR
jgi:hypothetical protein